MKKFVLAMAAAAALAFTAPAFAQSAPQGRMQLAQADVKVKTKVRDGNVVRKKTVIRHGDSVRRKVVIRDRGHHWRHRDVARRKVVIKHGPGRTVIKKKIITR